LAESKDLLIVLLALSSIKVVATGQRMYGCGCGQPKPSCHDYDMVASHGKPNVSQSMAGNNYG